jgi:hypothetical protein
MSQLNAVVGIEQILLADSYVLAFSREDKDIAIEMEFTLATRGLGQMTAGRIIFPEVEKEEWRRDSGELSSLEGINGVAHRYSSGPDDDGSQGPPDMGCIDSIRFANGDWHVLGDWGSACFRTKSSPRVVIGGDLARR